MTQRYLTEIIEIKITTIFKEYHPEHLVMQCNGGVAVGDVWCDMSGYCRGDEAKMIKKKVFY